MKLHAILIFAIFSRVVVGAAIAQGTHSAGASAAPSAALLPPPPIRLDGSMVRFFSGDWVGQGSFANGGAISAKVSFRLTLDSSWLVCEHRDDPPGQYAATLYWGVDAGTGQFLAYNFDNFQGHRVFTGNATGKGEGWRLVLLGQAFAPGIGTYYEHFIYQRLSDTQFKMSYETSMDAISWRLGDSLVFTRKG